MTRPPELDRGAHLRVNGWCSTCGGTGKPEVEHYDQTRSDPPGPGPVCQYCLADSRYTPVAFHVALDRRCPVCGAAYTGPRRSAAFQALLQAGLVAKGD